MQFDKCGTPKSDIPTLHFQDSTSRSPSDILVTGINAILIIHSTLDIQTWIANIADTCVICAFSWSGWLAMWNQIEGCEWLIKHILIMCARVTAMNYTITRYWPHTSHYGQRIVNSANISFLESSEEMRIIKMLPSWLVVVIGHRVNKNFMSFRTTISCFITQEDCLQARSCCSWSSWIDFIFYNLLQLNLDPKSNQTKNLTCNKNKFWRLLKNQ